MSSTLTRGCRLQVGFRVSLVLCALLAFSGPALFAQTPAGTRIVSRTTGSYEASTGAVFTFSDSVVVVVGQVSGAGITPPRTAMGDAGVTSIIGHSLTNMGNGDDSLAVTASSRHGWPTRIYRDANGNGALDPGELLLTTPVFLAMQASAEILVAVVVPGIPAVRGVVDTIDVNTASRFDPSVTASLYDVLTIRDAGITIALNKSANRPSAAVGDLVTYTVAYSSSGAGSATEFEITDPIPAGSSYVAGTMRLNGVALTDPDGDDAGFFDVPGNRVIFRVGAISAGQSGTVTFQVRVDR
jgi:trimeric autotransporter adhesin